MNRTLAIVGLTLALAATAVAQEPLRIVGWFPLKGDVVRDQIICYFDREIVVPPGADGKPAGFIIEPPVKGSYRVGSNFIAFTSSALNTSNENKVSYAWVNSDVRGADGGILAADTPPHGFSNVEFKPTRLWFLENASGIIAIAVSFSLPVDVDTARGAIELTDANGAIVEAKLVAVSSPHCFRVEFPEATPLPVTIRMKAGLPTADGLLRMTSDKDFRYPRPMQVTGCVIAHVVAGKIEIGLTLSEATKLDKAKEAVKVINAESGAVISSEINVQGKGVILVCGDSDPKPTQVTVTVAKGLEGENLAVLEEDYSTTLTIEHKSLSIEYNWWSRESRKEVSLGLSLSRPMPLEEVRANLTVTPEVTNLRVDSNYTSNVTLHGDWKPNQSYDIVIRAAAKDETGEPIGKDVTLTVVSEDKPKYLEWAYSGKLYFPRKAGASMPLESSGVSKVRVSLSEVFRSNIPHSISNLMGYLYSEESDPGYEMSREVGNKAFELAKTGDTIKTPVIPDELMPSGKRGLFILKAESEQEGDWASPAYKVLINTNIGLLCHWRDTELVLFAHDLFSLAPLNLARVTVYSSRKQVMAEANTDERGIARLTAFDPSLGSPKLVVVETPDDFTLLELSARPEDMNDIKPEMPSFNRKGYDTFIHADRDIYRPGETVHARWIVRTNYGDAAGNVPMLFTVRKPNGQELFSEPTTLNEVGAGGRDIVLDPNYPTGTYTIQIGAPDSKTPTGSYTFKIEDFVPNRIEAKVTLDNPRWIAGQESSIKVTAKHLFGAVAEGRKVEAVVLLTRSDLTLPAWKDYRFGSDSDYKSEVVPCGEAETDGEGAATLTFQHTLPAVVRFPLKATVIARVHELGGRAVTATADAMLLPDPTSLGIAMSPEEGGQGVKVSVAAVNPDETTATLPTVKVTLERQTWNYYVRRYYDENEPNWSERFEAVETKDVPLVDGRGEVSFQTPDWGSYRVRVHSDATRQASSLMFYAFDGKCEVFNSARPSLLKITADKPSYAPGESVRLRLESAFDGKAVVLLQGEGFHDVLTADIVNKTAELRFIATREQCPNLWAEATVVHAVKTDKKQVYPFSSFAMTSVVVSDPERKLQVAFAETPAEIRPVSPLAATVEVRDFAGAAVANAELTVAAVDEGIHGITGYRTPDPYAWLCRSRKPDERRTHYYDKVAYDYGATDVGGDSAENELAKRLPNVGKSWIQPLALWSGSVRTDAEGRAKVSFNVPEFTGQLRLVVVADSPTATGAAEARTFVRRPCMTEVNVPRFLRLGDRCEVNINAYNHSDKTCKVVVKWSGTGLKVEAGPAAEAELAPNGGQALLMATITPEDAALAAELKVETVFTNAADGAEMERITQSLSLPLQPVAAFQSKHALITLKPGEKCTLANKNFVEDERFEGAVHVGASPFLRLDDSLRYLVHYPYGCGEQVTSTLFPMYVLRKADVLVKGIMGDSDRLKAYLKAGIGRLMAMQTESGGLAAWPGSNSDSPYISVYAGHFLTLAAKDSELGVPESGLKELHKYLKTSIAGAEGDGSSSCLLNRAYALYVLTLAGDVDAARQLGRFDTVPMPTPARFLLAAATALATQDKDRVKLYLSQTPVDDKGVVGPDAEYWSDIRNKAMEFLALSDAGVTEPAEMDRRARELVDYVVAHGHGNTQETAMVVTALAQYTQRLAANVGQAAATIVRGDAKTEVRGSDAWRDTAKGPGLSWLVTNTGSAPIFVSWTMSGIPTQIEPGPVAEGGLTVTRRLLKASGEEVSGADIVFAPGEACVVDLKINCSKPMESVVLVDMLPAGFEVDNPRLQPDAVPQAKLDEATAPSWLDLRDDRLIIAWDDLKAGDNSYHYVARAVFKGVFAQPQTAAECMYDAAVRSATVAEKVEVK